MIENEPDSTHEQLQEKHFVTPQEMSREKLPPEEILSLPMFKVHIAYVVLLCQDVWFKVHHLFISHFFVWFCLSV